ncbi:hypothetical protein [Winogradskyella immobilis]|uniref:Uncharacterized protein n=1 Tax=Winogradskyella immobilis TaxID=2816852 RepID=A0ABS8EKT1_9FLAO|nr:hypothetical protein [Winogradskyella immobilis]MCC1483824.1 hypothetical protein [Winogradskyella immobilis]MCG0015918.1 hypothetical protein [Winogradskyella immobilis]
MKKLMTALALIVVTISFAQTKNLKGDMKISDKKVEIERMSIHVTVDSEEDLKSTFTVNDIEDIFDDVKDGEDISFKITCNREKTENGLKSNISYSIKGNSNNKKEFLKGVETIREKAIKCYKSK